MATVTQLVSAPVLGISKANGINDAGLVVGQEDTTFAFVWQPQQPNGTTGTANQLPVHPSIAAGEANAVAINNSDAIVGYSEVLTVGGTQLKRAVLWTGGPPLDLGTLIPDPNNPGSFLGESRALDINDSGLIVGEADAPGGGKHAFLFDPAAGIPRDLGTLSGGTWSQATSINSNGDVVGVSETVDASGTHQRAFLLPAGALAMIDLGTLLPDPANPGSFLSDSSAAGINDNGMIVGDSDAGAGLTAATMFSTAQPPTSILAMHSSGWDIGPADHVVGSYDANLDKGFVFHTNTGLVDLTTLAATAGMDVIQGTGANRVGQVAAIATVGGFNQGVLIT